MFVLKIDFYMKKYLQFIFFIILIATIDEGFWPGGNKRKDFSKKQPVPGASITLKDTYDGTTSDSSGNFKFSTTEKGDHILL